jgi:hypothetical protein
VKSITREMMGFAKLNPSYELVTNRMLTPEARGSPAGYRRTIVVRENGR